MYLSWNTVGFLELFWNLKCQMKDSIPLSIYEVHGAISQKTAI